MIVQTLSGESVYLGAVKMQFVYYLSPPETRSMGSCLLHFDDEIMPNPFKGDGCPLHQHACERSSNLTDHKGIFRIGSSFTCIH